MSVSSDTVYAQTISTKGQESIPGVQLQIEMELIVRCTTVIAAQLDLAFGRRVIIYFFILSFFI